MKPFKIAAFLLVCSVPTAPYLSFIGHAAIHLITSHHEHHDEEPASHHHSHEHHVITLTPLSLALIVSNFKIQPIIEIASGLICSLQTVETDPKKNHVPLGNDPPPRTIPFISFQIHPANAPPLR